MTIFLIEGIDDKIVDNTKAIQSRQTKIETLRTKNVAVARQIAVTLDRERRSQLRNELRRNRVSIRKSNQIIDKLKRQQTQEVKRAAQAAAIPGAGTRAQAQALAARAGVVTRTGLVVGTTPLERRVPTIARRATATVVTRDIPRPERRDTPLGQRPSGLPPVQLTTREELFPRTQTVQFRTLEEILAPLGTLGRTIAAPQARRIKAGEVIREGRVPTIPTPLTLPLAIAPLAIGVGIASLGAIVDPIQSGFARTPRQQRAVERIFGAEPTPRVVAQQRFIEQQQIIGGIQLGFVAAPLFGAATATVPLPAPPAVPSSRPVAVGFRARTTSVLVDPLRPPTRAVPQRAQIEAGFNKALSESTQQFQSTLIPSTRAPTVSITETGARIIQPRQAASIRRAGLEDVFDIREPVSPLGRESLARLQRVTMREEALADPTQQTLQRLITPEGIVELRPARGSIPLESDISAFRAGEFQRSIIEFTPIERPPTTQIFVDPTTGVTAQFALGDAPLTLTSILGIDVTPISAPRIIGRPPITTRAIIEPRAPTIIARPTVTEPFRVSPLTINFEEATRRTLESTLALEPTAFSQIPRQPLPSRVAQLPVLTAIREPINILESIEITAQRQRIETIPAQRTRTRARTIQEQQQEQLQITIPEVIQKTILDTTPKTISGLIGRPTPDRPPRRPQELLPRTPVPIFPIPTFGLPSTATPRFRVIVGRAGNVVFKDLGVGGISLVRKGRRLAETTAAATVRVAAVSKEADLDQAAKEFGKNFRLGKGLGEFIQRREARISTPGEVAGISLLGAAAQRSKPKKEKATKKKKKKKGITMTNTPRLFNNARKMQVAGISLRNIRNLLR